MDIQKAVETMNLKTVTSVEDVKTAFRKLAHQYHPDKNPEHKNGVKFQELVRAYKYLMENILLVFKHFGVEGEVEAEITARTAIKQLDDIFDDIFGFSHQGRILGYQESQDVWVKLEDYVTSTPLKRKIWCYQSCFTCQGAGAKKGASVKVCSYCFGRGVLNNQGQKQGCPKCFGRGRQISEFCSACDGFGRIKVMKSVSFQVPYGALVGTPCTVSGRAPGTNEEYQIFVRFFVTKHPIFQIDHYDLLCEYHVDLSQFSGPQTCRVDTPLGPARFTIPADISSGDVIVVQESGLYTNSFQSHRGELRVLIKDKVPGVFLRLWRRFFG